MRPAALLVAVLPLLGSAAQAAEPYLVRDINQQPAGIGDPGVFAALGDRLYVAARDADISLWTADASPAATRLVWPLSPGAGNQPELARAGSRLFFRSYDRSSGTELWALEEP